MVEEAARTAAAEGLEAVTLAHVADALGVRPPSLYNHVSGHDGLVRLIALRSMNELADAMRHAAVGRAGADGLPRSRTRTATMRGATPAATQPPYARPILQTANTPPPRPAPSR